MKYSNPILPGFYPDPSICRVGEWFYLVTSTFEYFPGVPVFKSKDLANWEQIGHCLDRKSQLKLDKVWASGGIYAPTIRYNEGIFYMVTTNIGGGGNFFVYTEDIEGEWSEPIWVNIGGIDPTLYFDEDGKVYIATNQGVEGKECIVLAELDIKTGELLSEISMLWEGTGGRCLEAPHLYKKDGWYYLIVAEGGTEYGHMVTIARSKNIWGPYESCPGNPILTHRNTNDNPIQATGHADMVEDEKGNWWMVCLGIRPSVYGFHHLGRETFLAPVRWSEEGWPIVNENKPIELEMESDCMPEEYKVKQEGLIDHFEEKKLGVHWNYVRNPYMQNYSLEEKGSHITLTGSHITLDDQDSPTMICRRQREFECQVMTKLLFNPTQASDEAGLSVFYAGDRHYEIGVINEGGSNWVIVRKRVGDMTVVAAKDKVDTMPIVLSVSADRSQYKFGWGKNEEEIKYIATGKTYLISTEVSPNPSFTGVYFGIYAISEYQEKAYFDWVKYVKG